ncbi:DUF2889 domain-containing protein [Bradyrhizobium jicamae]|uniref:DUF2889 domain-containing protein n=1 Tax=Bradyrhizobium jicamae TaxID=280332 RepID=A0ABS5FQ40_9BRAD|nr:DUF2889 domain-containing protein [Bradyrhizobium jicamae]MBR0798893.1 DUF2889 domain-containing protein [Bradyrhizobium jicamae]MBR0938591.1 DUF2889 domain-containing protein [Bradyrhizobium jicamae]
MSEHDANAVEKPRRLMHRRSVECLGYLRDDGLWEVEARLVDTKPYARHERHRGELRPEDPVHDIRLRLAVDDSFTIREAGTTMAATPYPSCLDVEGILQRLVGERIGKGWREIVRRKIGKLETCTHLQELLGPAVTTLFQTATSGKTPQGRGSLDQQQEMKEPPFFVGGCHSWRLDGPVVAEMFPQFSAAKPVAKT